MTAILTSADFWASDSVPALDDKDDCSISTKNRLYEARLSR